MNTGAKVAIGCGVAVVLAGLAVVVAVGGVAWFAKSKIESMAADQEEIESLKAEVNAQPWSPPADGVISEDRLQSFLAVRRQVHDVYQRYQDQLEPGGEDVDLSDITGAFSMLSDLRRVHAQAQASEGMGDSEYTWMVGQVYQSMWAAALEETTGETSTAAAVEQAAAALEAQLESSELSDQQREALEQQIEQMRASAAASAGQLEVPAENVALFRRYKDQIELFTMPGLELLAL